MKLLDRFNQTLGLTKTETRVVLFLAATFLAGIGIQSFKSRMTSEPRFNYAAIDSEFAARSKFATVPESARSQRVRPIQAEALHDPPGVQPASININLASREELIALPGIGETMADRILQYRTANGPFATVQDLRNVKGIGGKKLERIAPYCTVGK